MPGLNHKVRLVMAVSQVFGEPSSGAPPGDHASRANTGWSSAEVCCWFRVPW